MTEKQAFHNLVVVLTGLAFSLVLASCQPAQLSIAMPPEHSIAFTRTPFQPQLPTPSQAATLPPTSTAVPTSTETSTAVPSATPDLCLLRQGQVESHTVEFSNPAAPLTFRVYLPPCFGAQAGYRYPVLYLIHGQTYTDDQWDRLGIDEAADALIAAQEADPFLIVMPREANTFGDIFTSSFPVDLIEGLVPWIDANYPTCEGRACRAIGGLSRGGAWALNLGLTHWELFGAIGLHSTPPFLGDPRKLPAWLEQIPPGQLPRMYLDTGKRDWYIIQTTSFEQLLVEYGVPHEWYLFNGTHEEAYWAAHVADYLAWYTRPWNDIGQ